ncbi:hypothetical protein QYF61_003356 [Mycteria americana]|uniref:Murine leukemia virus integrase C-terminal domain-containing protein n=1 Tax=Mycteria americana TaxID=33587 RepID=A0AAN7MKD9_MYCAM|nr:hypothetical protein QYF61_003356 [Mycteria americana]
MLLEAIKLPREIAVHDLQPGDRVLLKVFSCKSKLEARWEGPYTVLLSSYFAVKFTGKEAWIHHSHVKQLLEDRSVDEQLLVEEGSTAATVLET